MYRYDQTDIRFVRERVEEYRSQCQRRIRGELAEDEFRPLRLMNGLYLQRHAYMLRIAVPYGLLSSAQMRKLAFISERYDRGVAHWTTRQNVQLNWIKLEDTPDILGHLADVEMHAMQTSGNCVRNITCDPWAGVAPDELFDVRPWCEILRQYTTLHPEFMYLPRKFKIAFSGAAEDRAAVQVHDIGVEAMRDATSGGFAWRVYAGGGLGRTPRVGQIVREGLPLDEIVAYCEAILRVYNQFGRRDNRFKARIKILVGELGIDAFRAEVEREYAEIPDSDKHVDLDRIAAIQRQLEVVQPDPAAVADAHAERAQRDPAFKRWVDNNTIAHGWGPAYRIAMLSLKHPGRAPGDTSTAQLYSIADLMDRFSSGYGASTYQQNLALQFVKTSDLSALYDALVPLGLATPNIGTVQDIICCPGIDYCNLANAASIPIAKAIHERFLDLDEAYDLGPVHIKMSGCINACGHHHVGHIGILGIDKRGEDYYQVGIGGSAGTGPEDPARVGRILGQSVSPDRVVDVVEQLLEVYRQRRQGTETFVETVQRLGVSPFQEAIYG